MNRKLGFAAGACVVVGMLAAASCRKPERGADKVVYVPGENTNVVLTLRAPDTGQFTTFDELCADAGASALLITMDTATQAGAYVFLANLAGTLYNCGGPCLEGEQIAFTLNAPVKVRVEAIDGTPEDYLAGTPYDVVCRGVADTDLGMGAIEVTSTAPPPTETPIASPTPNPTTTTIDATVPMLRVGDFNGTFDAEADLPRARHLAASLYYPKEVIGSARTATGGRIVVGGGLSAALAPVATIHEFDPVAIGFTPFPATLQTARWGLSATAILDSAGNPMVVFAGGSTDGANQFASSNVAEIVRPGETSTQSVSMRVSRAFHSATYVHTHNTDEPVVVLIGGCNGGGTPAAASDYEYFYGNLPSSTAGLNCAGSAADYDFCRPNLGGTGVMDPPGGASQEGHCQHAAGLVMESGTPLVFVAGGISNATTTLQTTYTFNAATTGSFTNRTSMSNTLRGSAAEALSLTTAATLGGFVDSTQAASSVWIDYAPVGQVIERSATAMVPRGFHAARRLLDKSVLITGGTNLSAPASGLASVERLANGAFSLVSRAGGTCIDDGTDAADCVTMVGGRYGHQMVLIEGSATWLNGALLVVGGLQDPEIFVPAYDCNSSGEAVDLAGAPILSVDYCDRSHPTQALTALTQD